MVVQILPKDDAFAYGSPNYGNNVLLWLGCKSTTGSTPFAFGNGIMHSAYQTIVGSTVYTNAGITTSDSESEAQQLRARGMMWRVPYSETSTVTATVQMLTLGGVPTSAHIAPRGVIGRIQGGSIADSTGDQIRYEGTSCYMGTVHRDGSGNFVFSILKCSSGTVTTLASQTLSPASVALIPVASPLTIEMALAGGAGATTIDVTFRGWGSIANIDLAAADSSAIAGTSRYGFIMGRDRAVAATGVKAADICTSFRVSSSGTVNVHDRFDRYQLSSYRAHTDQFSNPGFSLGGAFGWDHWQPSQVRRMKRHLSVEAAQYLFASGDADNEGRVMLSSRPSTSVISQHRSSSLTFSAQPTAGNVWFGIAVRAAQPTQVVGAGPDVFDFPNFTGYVASVTALSASTSVIFTVTRWRNGVSTALALYLDATTAYWNGYASPIVLDFDVYNKRGLLDDDVILKLRVDGAQVPLLKIGADPSLTVDVLGTITDSHTNRITSGAGEGFTAINVNNENATTVTIDDWQENSLTNAEVADQDQPSIIVLDETLDAVGSLNDVIGYKGTHIEEPENFGMVEHFESGHRQGIPRFTDDDYVPLERVRFQLGVVLTSLELNDFRDFWSEHDGQVIPFTWQRVFDAVPWKVHFYGDSYELVYVALGIWRLTFALETLTDYSVAAAVAADPGAFEDLLGHEV